MHDRTDHQVTYLARRLTQAQGSFADLSSGKVEDHKQLLDHARKQSRSAKGGKFTLNLHRRYRTGPEERGSSVTVVLHLQNKDNWLTFDPKQDIEVKYNAGYTKTYRPIMETIPVEVVKSYRDTWMAILDAINGIRAERRR